MNNMNPESRYPFLGPKELPKKIAEWTVASELYENHLGAYDYRTSRMEGAGTESQDIDILHNQSLLAWLQDRIAREPGKVEQVLDIGGGAALYAAQLRQTLGSAVNVYTTGLRKAAAKGYLRKLKNGELLTKIPTGLDVPSSLHPNDLKWRSVLELEDFPEFDLMVDSVGEFAWGCPSDEDVKRYCLAVIQKLVKDGMASILVPAKKIDQVRYALEQLQSDPAYSNIFTYHLEPSGNHKDKKEEEAPRFVLKIVKVGTDNHVV